VQQLPFALQRVPHWSAQALRRLTESPRWLAESLRREAESLRREAECPSRCSKSQQRSAEGLRRSEECQSRCAGFPFRCTHSQSRCSEFPLSRTQRQSWWAKSLHRFGQVLCHYAKWTPRHAKRVLHSECDSPRKPHRAPRNRELPMWRLKWQRRRPDRTPQFNHRHSGDPERAAFNPKSARSCPEWGRRINY